MVERESGGFRQGLALGIAAGLAVAFTLGSLTALTRWRVPARAPQDAGKDKTKSKKVKSSKNSPAETSAFEFPPIGTLRSCFRECRGTPRQGLFVSGGVRLLSSPLLCSALLCAALLCSALLIPWLLASSPASTSTTATTPSTLDTGAVDERLH